MRNGLFDVQSIGFVEFGDVHVVFRCDCETTHVCVDVYRLQKRMQELVTKQ